MGNPGSEAAEPLREQSPLCFCFKPLIFLARLLARLFLSLFSEAWHSREAHVPSANLMAASSNMRRNYHVFLSFRGPDVRQGFLSHLYAALDGKGIYTFADSEELRKGEELSPTLMRAIEESRIAIIVFSENYASSRWCLEELLKIMECKERNGLIVFPVFYKVEPRDVRGGRESYGRAMATHESKVGKDSEKVKRWKEALFKAGSLSGWELNDRNEAELIQCIVKELSTHLNRTPLHVANYPVGIDSQVQQIISLSKKESDDDDVLMIGLWGLGGIGKTTIAKALYNAMERQFQGCSFLEQVREKSNRSDGLVTLQKDLLSEILVHPVTVYSVAGGISLIQERLCCKKVLLILDDVDHMNQLNALAGKGNWFGKGSIIIVTTRNKQLLTSHGINRVCRIQTLGYYEAQDLFCLHAFPDSKSVEIRMDLIVKALHYCDGLPLALEVLGSFLCGRNEAAWESALRRLSESPDQTINQVLKTSFDGLDNDEREIFLDIACFFKGKRIEYIQEVLDSCGYETIIGIEILIERSLIKNKYGSLQMHDLVQLMGTNIAKQECRDDPGKRSRLWLLEDVEDIFCYNTGTDAVKAIVLDLRLPEAIVVDLPPPEAIIISPDAFTNMKKLRMLILLGVHISSQAQVRLPNELRWLEWPNAPNLEFGSGRNKLVRLDVPKSHIRQLGGNFHNFGKLKSINFSECKYLVSICDLSSAPNMEKLILNGRESLVEVHPSVGNLVKLEVLSLESCSNLSNFPNTLRNKSLRTLDLSGCSKFEKFPDIDGKIEHLKRLDLRGTAIKELPASIENLVSVESMNLTSCKNLVRLNVPKSHIRELGGNSQNFSKLKSIDFSECKSLVSICDLSLAPNMEKLILNGCESLVEVHPSVGNLVKLEVLSLKSCSNLSNFPNTLRTKSLQTLNLSGCSKFEKFPDIDGKMEHLNRLYLDRTAIKELPASIENLVSVKQITLAFCKNLVRLPWHIYKLKNLKSLNLSDCLNLITFPINMEDSTDPNVGFQNLWFLKLSRCNLSEVDFLESFSSFPILERLYLLDNKFTYLPTCINKYHRLCELSVDRCELLEEIPQLPPSIMLSARCCRSLQKFPDLGGRPYLALYLSLTSCYELSRRGVTMADVADLSLLEDLPKVYHLGINLPGREMPKWILPCEEDSISFMIPQELYDKFKGVALCVVLGPEEGKVVNASCSVEKFVNGQSAGQSGEIFYSIESDHVWFDYYSHISVNLRYDWPWSHYQVCLRAKNASIKKCGFRPICKQKEDVLRMVIPAPSADGNKLQFSRSDSKEESSIDTIEADDLFEECVRESSYV